MDCCVDCCLAGNPSATLFPKWAETINWKAEHLSVIRPSVLDCLKIRSEAGFELKRLKAQGASKHRRAGRQSEMF